MVSRMPAERATRDGFRAVDITVDRDSPTPLYHQIYAAIEQQISDGVLKAGERIQQERDLAATLGISLAPVRQAILSLVRDGYLERTRGRGTFVRERAVEEQLSILSSFSSLLEATGRPWSMELVSTGIVTAGDVVAAALGGVTRVLEIRRVAVLDGEPVALLEAALDAERFGALAKADLDGSLYARLARDFDVTMSSATNEIGMVRLTRDEAAVLRQRPRDAVLEVVGVTNDQHDVPTEYSRVLYHPARFRFRIDSRRHDEAVLRLLAPPEG
jgi:DNA-binding GntR family transcriptional regulator